MKPTETLTFWSGRGTVQQCVHHSLWGSEPDRISALHGCNGRGRGCFTESVRLSSPQRVVRSGVSHPARGKGKPMFCCNSRTLREFLCIGLLGSVTLAFGQKV